MADTASVAVSADCWLLTINIKANDNWITERD
jgi:hypothetical protein